jgi:hypothetical protein
MLERALDLFDRHKYGVIGTLMLHTMLLFVLTMARVYRHPETATANELQVMLDLPPLEEQDPMTDERPPSPASAADVTNRTSNATAEPDRSPPMSSAARARMGQRVEEDLRNLEQAEFDKLAEERRAQGKEVTVPQLDPSKFDKRNYLEKPTKPVKVEGLTTVSYDLAGRSDIVLEVPAYLCKGSGTVAVLVAVDAAGNVRRSELDPARTTTRDECMVEHALASAAGARFTRSSTAPDPQRGTITYIFLPQ